MQPPALNINISQPLWIGARPIETITHQLTDYSHSIEAIGGYWSASFSIRGNQMAIENWIENGLGRHIEVYDDALVKIWEGFVNRIGANVGPLSVQRGPLLDVANRVNLVYSTVDTSTDPPTVGGRAETGYSNDADSQALYGIIPKILSTGGVRAADAAYIVATYLAEHNLPKTTKSIRTDNAGECSATIDCLGYVHWLNYPYNTTSTAAQTTTAKLTAILAATPNTTWLTYGTTYLSANAMTVTAYEDEDKLALAVIKEIVARGDTSANRWLFGVYAGREARYEAAPTTLEYQQRLGDPKVRVETPTGQEVYPWNVLPGKWLLFPDFLVGKVQPTSLREDARALFIEGVTYRAPWGLEIRGGEVDRLSQVLGQLGITGVGS